MLPPCAPAMQCLSARAIVRLDTATAREVCSFGLLDGLGTQAHELVALGGGPGARGLQIGQGALEVGLDVARHQLIAVQHLLPRAPLSGPDQQATKATALLVE